MAEDAELGLEEVKVGNELLSLPASWLNQPGLTTLFSLKTWNRIPAETQTRLVDLLPRFEENDQQEKIATLKMLLTPGTNIRFGNPVDRFKEELVAGRLHPDTVNMKRLLNKINSRRRREELRQRELKVISDLLRQLNDPKDGAALLKRQPAPSKFEWRVADRYAKELRMIRTEVGENEDSSDDESILRQVQNGPEAKLTRRDVQKLYYERKRTSAKRKQRAAPNSEPKSLLVVSRPKQRRENKSLLKQGSGSVLKPKSLLVPRARQDAVANASETNGDGSWSSFFARLKNVFESHADRRTVLANVVNGVKSWRRSYEWLHENDLECQVGSALKFLMGTFPKHLHPPGFVPLVKFNPLTGSYTWLADDDDCDEGKLAELEALWRLQQRQLKSETVPDTDFHAQESLRMSNPSLPFTYRLKGRPEVSVGPVRVNQTTSKVKPHPLLVADRPPHVTFIVLVQEALARLPAGQGTKADICALVRESQYVNLEAVRKSPNALAAVVSGALDRLQGENRPPCKYIPELRMWKNLHYGKTEWDFVPVPASKPKQRRTASTNSTATPEELIQNAVDSILPEERAELPTVPLPPPTEQMVQLMTPQGIKMVRVSQDGRGGQAQHQTPMEAEGVANDKAGEPQRRVLNVGGRQIVLSGTHPSPPAAGAPPIAPPQPPNQQQQMLVQAKVGGRTVFITPEQLRRVSMGNMSVVPNAP